MLYFCGMAEKVILEVELDASDTEANIDDITGKVIDLQKANTDLRKDLKKTDDELEKENKTRIGVTKTLEKNKTSITKLNAERRNSIKVQQAEKNSIEALEQSNATLVKQRRKLNLATQEGIDKYSELTDQIEGNTEKINGFNEAIGRSQGRVGKYSEALDKARGGLKKFGNTASNVVGAIVAATLIFKAIEVAINFVVDAFKNAAGGGQRFTAILAKIEGAMAAVTGAVGAFASALFEGKGFDEAAKNFDGLQESIEKSAAAYENLRLTALAFERLTSDLTVSIQKLNAQSEIQQQIADDATLSLAKQDAAARKAVKFRLEAAALERVS